MGEAVGAVPLIAGCAEISTDAYVFVSENALISSSLRNITFEVSSSSALLRVGNAIRTIAPTAYNSNDLKFYLGNLHDNMEQMLDYD